MFAVIDLTAVTDGAGDIVTAVLAAAALVIASGLGLMAVKWGGKYVLRLFKSFSS